MRNESQIWQKRAFVFFVRGHHAKADYNSWQVGVVDIVVVVHTLKNRLTLERLNQYALYLKGSCTRVSRSAAYAYEIVSPEPAQPAYQVANMHNFGIF